MSNKEELKSEIPDFVKKYVPGVSRGLSWAKYSNEKADGTALKLKAFNDSEAVGYTTALKTTESSGTDSIRDITLKKIWDKADELTEQARKISLTINQQKSKEKREEVLDLARIAARKAGIQAAIAAGWEKGWNKGIAKRDSDKSN